MAGALLISLWGGPKRRVHGVLMGMVLNSLFGIIVLGIGQSVPVWAAGAFFRLFFMPLFPDHDALSSLNANTSSVAR